MSSVQTGLPSCGEGEREWGVQAFPSCVGKEGGGGSGGVQAFPSCVGKEGRGGSGGCRPFQAVWVRREGKGVGDAGLSKLRGGGGGPCAFPSCVEGEPACFPNLREESEGGYSFPKLQGGREGGCISHIPRVPFVRWRFSNRWLVGAVHEYLQGVPVASKGCRLPPRGAGCLQGGAGCLQRVLFVAFVKRIYGE